MHLDADEVDAQSTTNTHVSTICGNIHSASRPNSPNRQGETFFVLAIKAVNTAAKPTAAFYSLTT